MRRSAHPSGCLLFAAAMLLPPMLFTTPSVGDTVPTDGMVITSDTTLAAGTYSLPQGIVIGASGITVSANGTVIVGSGSGNGVAANGMNNVTVSGLTVRNYFHGMHFYNCDDLTVENCNVWETPELPEGSIFLNIFDGPNGSYAHAVWLRYCDRATIRDNDVSDQQNGISLFNCSDALVTGNYASYNTGWGICFYDTDSSTVRDNVADYCTRDYYGWSGADAASFLIVYGSDNNDVQSNSFVGGGDGVFLAGATHSLQKKPNNFNYFAYNDCSYSPNNGFEATFSGGNVFEHNISDGCNYGYWLGYSYDNEVRNNRVNGCATAGIAIEHGRNNVIEGNTLDGNSRGIYLWTDEDADLVAAYPEAKDSYGYTISDNTISHNIYGLACEANDANRFSYDYTVTSNAFTSNSFGIRFVRTDNSTLRSNRLSSQFVCGVRLEFSTGNLIYNNRFENAANAWDNSSNTWNTAKIAGTNIVAGPYLGGNYWSDYGGVDTDGDGLGDTELPYNAGGAIVTGGDQLPLIVGMDTDDDGLADEWEILHFGDLSQGPGGDPDDDDLDNLQEYILHTDPNDPDSDGDGLEDGAEVATYGTDPANPDSDGDGLNDGDELAAGTSPLDPDHDDDGMTDGWEVQYGLDPLVDDSTGDADADGLDNLEEFLHGTNPQNADTDSDGFTDAEEVAAGTNPNDPYSFPLGWLELAPDPSHFPYTDVVTPPAPDYWPRANLSVAAANGRIYAAGGYGPLDYTDSDGSTYYANRQSGFGIYDISGGSWSSARWDGSGPTGYNNGNGTAGPTVDQGTYTGNNQVFTFDRDGDGTEELFVLAGYPIWDGVFAIYDPDSDSWSNSAPRSFGGLMAAYHATALEWQGTAYVYGGQYNGPEGNGFFTYDIAADAWTQLPNGPVRMTQHCGEIVGDVMYLISGQQDSVDYATGVIEYYLTVDAWDIYGAAPIPQGVNRAASVVVDGKIYVIGGIDSSGQSTRTIQVYDPATNRWTTSFPLPEARSRHGAVAVGNMLYVVDGYGPAAGGGEENKSNLWAVDLTTADAPRVRVDTPASPTVSPVSLNYRLYDLNENICTIDVEYSANGGSTWLPASKGAGGEGTTGLTSAVTGRAHVFVWDAWADLGYGEHSDVRVRIVPTDSQPGTADATEPFAVQVRYGDFDMDGDMDVQDFAVFQACFRGTGGGIEPTCEPLDFDGNGDIDLSDHAEFIGVLSGPDQ